MNVLDTAIPEVKILEPEVFSDERGAFFEVFHAGKVGAAGISFHVVQENSAFSRKRGTIRGLHFQTGDMAQAKLVRCVIGRVMDFAVDIRKGSPTYLRHVGVELSAENRRQLFIPRGFAHGVITLEDDTLIHYFEDNSYSPEHGRIIRFDDPAIHIDWGMKDFVLSGNDRNAPYWNELEKQL